MISDPTLELILYVGIGLTAIGVAWLLFTAYRTSFLRGLATTFVPLLMPWHIFSAWPRTMAPALITVVGLSAAAFPPLYSRLHPIDLGERLRTVDGQKHLTLTGWDRKSYNVLALNRDAAVLQIANSDVTDDTLAIVGQLTALNELDLDGTAITDAGLKSLVPLTNLTRLRISRTRITDAGLRDSIAKLPALKQLWCPDTAITKPALDEWKAAGEGRRFVGGKEATPTSSTTDAPVASPSN